MPRPLARLRYIDNDRDEQIAYEHTLTADMQVTMESAEGEVVGLKPLHGTEWDCVDISGEITRIENIVALYSETMKLIKADLKMELSYDAEDNWMSIRYTTDFVRDMAVTGAEGKIEAWDHEEWSNQGYASRLVLWTNGAFQGLLHVTRQATNSYPIKSSSTTELEYKVYGLVDPLDYHQAYVCNLGRNSFPENLEDLTVDNIQDWCIFNYYECSVK